ncbi:MAG: hypothetical protein H6739_39810 [Alphaproteobacteria bacterium]|nr:hypothetical protein [Alphaproteobacteria bacterium]
MTTDDRSPGPIALPATLRSFIDAIEVALICGGPRAASGEDKVHATPAFMARWPDRWEALYRQLLARPEAAALRVQALDPRALLFVELAHLQQLRLGPWREAATPGDPWTSLWIHDAPASPQGVHTALDRVLRDPELSEVMTASRLEATNQLHDRLGRHPSIVEPLHALASDTGERPPLRTIQPLVVPGVPGWALDVTLGVAEEDYVVRVARRPTTLSPRPAPLMVVGLVRLRDGSDPHLPTQEFGRPHVMGPEQDVLTWFEEATSAELRVCAWTLPDTEVP